MRNYEVECQDPRDDMCINIFNIKADLFVVDDAHTTVTFYEEKEVCGMTPVAMFPFKYLVSVTTNDAVEE